MHLYAIPIVVNLGIAKREELRKLVFKREVVEGVMDVNAGEVESLVGW